MKLNIQIFKRIPKSLILFSRQRPAIIRSVRQTRVFGFTKICKLGTALSDKLTGNNKMRVKRNDSRWPRRTFRFPVAELAFLAPPKASYSATCRTQNYDGQLRTDGAKSDRQTIRPLPKINIFVHG
ncbi:hypothetical protein EVAR_43654_1 [Eumeta japonica]|uniref:Uncharacterized protein n=1 Tax=Eumeta variegata TaxID=151549 RepID=A0A4C1XU01_EUMVA|nr:hypothetical protein EVAR_43654_1 [Eumeta japonica]